MCWFPYSKFLSLLLFFFLILIYSPSTTSLFTDEKEIERSDHSSSLSLTLTEKSLKWYSTVSEIAMKMTVTECHTVSWERQIGFLHLLEQAVRLIGFGMSGEVAVLLKVVLAMLSGSQGNTKRQKKLEGENGGDGEGQEMGGKDEREWKEGDDNEEDDDEMDVDEEKTLGKGEKGERGEIGEKGEIGDKGGVSGEKEGSYYRDINQASKVRSLSLLRLSGTITLCL